MVRATSAPPGGRVAQPESRLLGALPGPRLRRDVQLLYDAWAHDQAVPVESLSVAAALARDKYGSFESMLRLYYPHATKSELRGLESLARTREDDERREWRSLASRQGDKVFALFGSMDKDGSCMIDWREFAEASAVAGLESSEVQSLFAEFDADGNGALDLSEFTNLVGQHGSIMRKFEEILNVGAQRKASRARRSSSAAVVQAEHSGCKLTAQQDAKKLQIKAKQQQQLRELLRPRDTAARGRRPSLADLTRHRLLIALGSEGPTNGPASPSRRRRP